MIKAALTSVIHAETMVYLEDKGSPYSLVPVIYQFCIPYHRKVEVKEGQCFRIRTQKLYVESRLILPCVYYVETSIKFFIACFMWPGHFFNIEKLWKFRILARFRPSYNTVYCTVVT